MSLNTLYQKELIDLEESCTLRGYTLRNDSLYNFRWFITCDSTRVFVTELDLRDYHEHRQQGGRLSLRAWTGGLGQVNEIHPAHSMIIWRKQLLSVALVDEVLFNPRNKDIVVYVDANSLAKANSELNQFPKWELELHTFANVHPGVMTQRLIWKGGAESEEELIADLKRLVPGVIEESHKPYPHEVTQSNL